MNFEVLTRFEFVFGIQKITKQIKESGNFELKTDVK